MKKRTLSLLLTLALLAAFLPTAGVTVLPAKAEEEPDPYKTENVVVPEGWDYVEVSTVDELLAAAERQYLANDPQPMFIRLVRDLEMKDKWVGRFNHACISLELCASTIFDLNGHRIDCQILAENNGDNHTWIGLNVILRYGLVPEFTFRMVDSAGGGYIYLEAHTYVDGPTTALMIQGFPAYLPAWTPEEREKAPYCDRGVNVSIDGGRYWLRTRNDKFCGVQNGPILDSYGHVCWGGYAPYARSAVGLREVKATINNGNFWAIYPPELTGAASDMGRRFLSDLGLCDDYSAEHLRINGGVFNGSCYSVLWYNISNYDGELKTLPVLNGGRFDGGIQLCTTRSSFWKKVGGGNYELNTSMKDKKVSGILVPGAVMYMDDKAVDPDKTDLEDIAWPHKLRIEPGPGVLQSELMDAALLMNRNTGYRIQYNKKPDKVQLEEYITVIRLGKEQSYWSAHKTTDYILVPVLGTNYYSVTVPAQETAGVRKFRIRAFFGETELVTDPFEVEWVDTADFQFTYGPEVTSEQGVGMAMVEFDFSHPESSKRWALWWSNGDHWSRLEEVDWLGPNLTPTDRYRVFISELAKLDWTDDKMDYRITVEYDLGAEEPLEIESAPFTITKEMLGGDLPDPVGIGILPGVCTLSPEDDEQAVSVTLYPTASPHKTGFLAESSDPSVAEVVLKNEEGFVIRGLKDGSALITVTAAGGVQITCEVTVVGFSEGSFYGDVDGDGSVTSTDARLTLQLAVNKITKSDLAVPGAADVDRDGEVTSTDARLILQYAVNKITEWP